MNGSSPDDAAQSPSRSNPQPALNLHLKVTGIVFWGLMLLGTVATVVILRAMGPTITSDYLRRFDHAAVGLESALYANPPRSVQALRERLERIRAQARVARIELHIGLEEYAVGTVRGPLQAQSQLIDLPYLPFVAGSSTDQGVVVVAQPPLDQILTQVQKRLMVFFGVAFIVFGLVLQWILEHLLTRPIMTMVETARRFEDPNRHRFDETRHDEFGFLARFINRALDRLAGQQKQLSYHATHDPLTGLYNRREFERRLEQALREAREDRIESVLCYIDLDRFKVVNDTCGHVAGDALLEQVAGRLRAAVRSCDVLARLGGDEFAILLRGCGLNKARGIAESAVESITALRFQWDERVFHLGASVGLVAIDASSANPTDTLSCADVACYWAKDHGGNRVHVYQHEDDELQRRRGEAQWVSHLGTAMLEDRFELYAQEIVPVRSDARIPACLEILLRSVDERGDLVLPGTFLPAAERSKLMPQIDRWVIEHLFARHAEAIRRIHKAANACRHPCVSVNVSGQSLTDETFLVFLKERFARHGIPPASVCFEITETAAVANLGQAHQFIAELKRMGCLFALDDFGSGMSSFSYLKNLPADFLKIDGSYVRGLAHSSVDRALVEAVNDIGHAMGMRTIAEFVEDEAIFNALSVIGVDFAQGFGIARPQPVRLVLRRLERTPEGEIGRSAAAS